MPYNALTKHHKLNILSHSFNKILGKDKEFTENIKKEFTKYINLESNFKEFEMSLCDNTTTKLIDYDKDNNLITHLFNLDVVKIYETIRPYFIKLNDFVINQITTKQQEEEKQLEKEKQQKKEMEENTKLLIGNTKFGMGIE